MAERRMFAKTIIDSDAFLDMPLSTQALYFHLSMRADDEGFINNPKRIQRTIGASDDDMKLLLAKNFTIAFESGVIVIKHWKIHNYIQKDRCKETMYKEERDMLELNENNAYTVSEVPCIQNGYTMDTKCIHDVHKTDTQVSIGKYSIDNNTMFNEDSFEVFWKAYPRKQGKQTAKKSFLKIRGVDFDEVMSALETQKKSKQWTKDDGQFIPHPSTWINQRRWEDEIDGCVEKRQYDYSCAEEEVW